MGMTASRETIYGALLTQLRTAGVTFKTYSRRWRSAWDDPQSILSDLPMLLQWEQIENVVWTNRGIGMARTWEVKLEVYGKIPVGLGDIGAPDKTTPGASVLNPLLDAIEEALAPTGPNGVQTLGGLVLDCRIEGTIIKVLGDEDPSGLCGAIVPVRILVQ